MAPEYLTELIPPTVGERHNHALRRRNDLTLYRPRREIFSRSFFPSVVREWNNLPDNIRESPSLDRFNSEIMKYFEPPIKVPWYGIGERPMDIHHTRIRKLKSHLHFNLHVVENPHCACGALNENPNHFFFECHLFDQQRQILLNEVSVIREASLNLLLYGSHDLSYDENVSICYSVQKYIASTKRFQI